MKKALRKAKGAARKGRPSSPENKMLGGAVENKTYERNEVAAVFSVSPEDAADVERAQFRESVWQRVRKCLGL